LSRFGSRRKENLPCLWLGDIPLRLGFAKFKYQHMCKPPGILCQVHIYE